MVDLLESAERKEERKQKIREAELKDEITVLYNQALQIRNMTSNLINHEIPIRDLHEYYPGWFDEHIAEPEEEEQEDDGLTPEMREHKARMDDFIFRHNREFEKRGEHSGGNDLGETSGNNRGANESLLPGASEGTESDKSSN